MKKDLEILKNSQNAYIEANEKWLNKENAYILLEKELEEKYAQLKSEADGEYKRKLETLENNKKYEYSQFVDSANKEQLRLYAESCDRKLDHDDNLKKFRKEHKIDDQQMLKLLEKETGKQWKIDKLSYIGSTGWNGMFRTRHFDLIIYVYLINSDYYNFNGRLDATSDSHVKGVYPMLQSLTHRVLYDKGMADAKKQRIKAYGVDWLSIYLQDKGFLEEENPELVANNEIKNLITRAIDNYIFSENEDGKE